MNSDVARLVAYSLNCLMFALAAGVTWQVRRHAQLYVLFGLCPWLVLSLVWSMFLVVWAASGHSGNDTLAAISGYVRALGPASILGICYGVTRR